jgi:hypothetical protein
MTLSSREGITMSDDSLPASNGQYKPLHILDENLPIREVYGVLRVDGSFQPPLQPARAPKPRQQRKSGLYLVLQAAQQHGITHPKDGHFLMLPKAEFRAILALEHKAIAQVVLEIFLQTIGTQEYDQDGYTRRKEWATISYRHFARAGVMTSKAAQRGIKDALAKGYIVRRQRGVRSYEYAIRWRGTN